METLPNLSGVAGSDAVETIGGGGFKAQYINWSRTLDMLRTHAPGWMPFAKPAEDGCLVHRAPVGGYLLIGFKKADIKDVRTPHLETNMQSITELWPQAVMDHKNQPIPFDKITARDITDTHRRGVCAAAAGLFGLAFELWAKMPLENGYSQSVEEKMVKDEAAKKEREQKAHESHKKNKLRTIAAEEWAHPLSQVDDDTANKAKIKHWPLFNKELDKAAADPGVEDNEDLWRAVANDYAFVIAEDLGLKSVA